MKRFCSSLFRCFGIVVVCSFLHTSCMKDAYDLGGGIDTTMQLGGDSLYLPLGTTQEFTIGSLLGEDLLDGFLKVNASGVYVLSPEAETTEMELTAIESDQFKIADIVVDTAFKMSVTASKSYGPAKSVASMDWGIALDFRFDDLPEAILSLDELLFTNTILDLTFSFENLPVGLNVSQMSPDIYVRMPEEFGFSVPEIDAENRLHVTSFDETGFSVSLPLDKVLLDQVSLESHSLHFLSLLQFSGNIELGDGGKSLLALDQLDINVRCGVRDIDPDEVHGVFDPEIDEQEIEVAFDMIPDALRVPGTVLDFDDPHIRLQVKTNSDIPVEAHVEILPVSGGIEINERKQTFDIEIPATIMATETTVDYWIAGSTKSMPQGYTFVEADVAGLIRQIPDMLRIKVHASTDTSASHMYDFGKAYMASVSFGPEVPLEFGEDLLVSFSDTLTDLPAEIAKYIAGKELSLYGEIYNKFPLDFHMQLVALDEDFKPLDIELSAPQLIRAGNGSSEGISSRVEFGISDPRSVLKEKKLAAFRIACQAASNAEAAGIPVTEEASFKAELKLKIAGGLVIGGPDNEDGD